MNAALYDSMLSGGRKGFRMGEGGDGLEVIEITLVTWANIFSNSCDRENLRILWREAHRNSRGYNRPSADECVLKKGVFSILISRNSRIYSRGRLTQGRFSGAMPKVGEKV